MKISAEDLKKIDNSIYMLTVNIISLLKSLKKENISDEKTVFLSRKTKELSDKFNDFYDNHSSIDNITEIKRQLKSLIQHIRKIIISDIQEKNKQIIHEKASILFDTDRIEQMINKIE